MKKFIAAALAAMVLSAGGAQAASRVEVGRLSCSVEPGVGLILGSQKDMTCHFIRRGHKTEVYGGTISKIGLDIGFTDQTRIEWLVFSGSTANVTSRSLAGTYVGGSSEATIGVGLGGNWLIGGSRRGFALQPLSIQAQTGLNLSVAFAGLTLH
ncbi:MAG TPA: DUF992 domain-containing protein [Devosiaceae bacterium]|jgi:hypothetical protein|nr:DUF992 domain-containing protein [Devosiaceae bacterium]